jgi:hypothetical protein
MPQGPKFSKRIAAAFIAAGGVSAWLTYQSYINLPDYGAPANDSPDLNAEYPASHAPKISNPTIKEIARTPRVFSEEPSRQIKIANYYYDLHKQAKDPDGRFFHLRSALQEFGDITPEALQKAATALGVEKTALVKSLRESAIAYFRDTPKPAANASAYDKLYYLNNLHIAHTFTGIDDNGNVVQHAAQSATGQSLEDIAKNRNGYMLGATVDLLSEFRNSFEKRGIAPDQWHSDKVDPFENWKDTVAKISFEDKLAMYTKIDVIINTLGDRSVNRLKDSLAYYGMSNDELHKYQDLMIMINNALESEVINRSEEAYNAQLLSNHWQVPQQIIDSLRPER